MNSLCLHNKIGFSLPFSLFFQGNCFHDLFRSLTYSQCMNSLESTLLMRNNICVHNVSWSQNQNLSTSDIKSETTMSCLFNIILLILHSWKLLVPTINQFDHTFFNCLFLDIVLKSKKWVSCHSLLSPWVGIKKVLVNYHPSLTKYFFLPISGVVTKTWRTLNDSQIEDNWQCFILKLWILWFVVTFAYL